MSATMARQRGCVQLEQSNMCPALNMAKMATGGFSCAAIEEMQQLIKKPQAEVWEEKKQGVEFPGHKKVKAAIEWHLAIVYNNHMDGCLPCQNGIVKNPQTRWWRKESGAPRPQPAARPPGTPPVSTGDTDGNECYEMEGRPSRCVYIQSPHPNTQLFNHNAYANISKNYFSHWKPAGVSESMWRVNLDTSIPGEYQTLGAHSGRSSK